MNDDHQAIADDVRQVLTPYSTPGPQGAEAGSGAQRPSAGCGSDETDRRTAAAAHATVHDHSSPAESSAGADAEEGREADEPPTTPTRPSYQVQFDLYAMATPGPGSGNPSTAGPAWRSSTTAEAAQPGPTVLTRAMQSPEDSSPAAGAAAGLPVQRDGLDRGTEVGVGISISVAPAEHQPPNRLAALIAAPPATRGDSLARTPKTEADYEVRVRHLYRRSTRSRTTDPQQPAVVSPLDVVNDYIESAINHSEASWRLYRAAMLWHLANHKSEAPEYETAFQVLARTRKAPGSRAQLPADRRAYARKKAIPEDDLAKLLNVLSSMNRTMNWGSRTQFWLLAGLASGARPGEWPGASWLDESQETLCVPNTKLKRTVPIYKVVDAGQTIHEVEEFHPERLTPGPESDDSRRIRNVPIDPSDRIYVQLHLASLNDFMSKRQGDPKDAFFRYYDACRKAIREASLRAFKGKKLYSLYVMRSQFAANKKAMTGLKDVAHLMGHE